MPHVHSRLQQYASLVPKRPLVCIQVTVSLIDCDKAGYDPILAGKLRLMSAALLPVWHPSGLNRKAAYNTDIELDYEAPLKHVLNTAGIDLALYKHVWSVHVWTRNPSMAERRDGWSLVQTGMDKVLEALETLQPAKKDWQGSEEEESAMYMVSPTTLRLQLVDLRFRLRILVRYVLFLKHLELVGDTLPSGKESADLLARMEFCKALFMQGGEGDKMMTRAFKQMDRDSGGKFKRFVLPLLQMDQKWVYWKRTGYKHFMAREGEAPKAFKRRAVLSPVPPLRGDKAPQELESLALGDDEKWRKRQESWKVPSSDRMAPLKDPDRWMVPKLETLKSQLKEDCEDEDITEDMKRKNDTKFVWRSLRMLCEESVATLAQVVDLKAKGGCNLESCITAESGKPKTDEPGKDDKAATATS